VHLRGVLHLQQPAVRGAAGRRAVPAQVDLPGAAFGAAARHPAAGRTRALLGARPDRAGARRLGCSRLRPVPDDLPLEAAQRRMNGEDAWELGLGRWETYFGLVLASTVMYVLAEDGSWPEGAVAIILLAAMIPWYLLLGRRLIGRDTPGVLTYVYVA